MATALYDLTIPAFTRGLAALDALLVKAADHAQSQGKAPDAYLSLRLAEDMHPLSKQVQIACDSPKLCLARLSDIPAPVNEDTETTVDELRARIAQTLDYLASIPPEAVNGNEQKAVTLTFPGGSLPFTGITYVTGFALPNFYFHLTTTYALLRGAGIPLGKRDYMGA